MGEGDKEVGVVPIEGRGTVSFSRKVQVRDYEAAEAFMSVQFNFDPENDELAARAKEAYFEAKAVVFDELGIKYEVVDGIVREVIDKHFGRTTEVKKNADQGPRRSANTYPSPCPKCKGQMWDNRENKRNPKAPDAACKDKSCDGAVWPDNGKKA